MQMRDKTTKMTLNIVPNADLFGANLRNADLRFADLRSANLRFADLFGANLSCADLSGANLSGADLRSANLRFADLFGANLFGARGIVSFGPVGREKRIGYAVAHADGFCVQLGCFWGLLDAARAAIGEEYGPTSNYAALVTAAVNCLSEDA